MNTSKDILKELTQKQKRFCEEYVLDWNATRAAIAAGYSKKTANRIASENLSKLVIKEYIEEIQKDLEKLAGISRLSIALEHKKIAFSSIAHLHNTWIERKEFEKLTNEQKDCIAEIDTKTKREYQYDPEKQKKVPIEVEYVKIKLYDKQRSLESLSKMLGYNEPEKLQLGVDESLKNALKPFKEKK